MPVVQIRGGASVEIPDLAEIRAEIGAGLGPEARRDWWAEQKAIEDARERERYRGMKDMRRSTLLTTPAGTRVTILDGIAPEAGYKWVVRIVSVFLASAGTGQAYITSDTTSTLGSLTQAKAVASYTTSAAVQVATLPQGACILDEGEGLYLNFTQNINGYMLAGWEVPAMMIGKLA